MVTATVLENEIEWKGIGVFASEREDANYISEHAGKLWYYADENKEYNMTELKQLAKELDIDRKCMIRLGRLEKYKN